MLHEINMLWFKVCVTALLTSLFSNVKTMEKKHTKAFKVYSYIGDISLVIAVLSLLIWLWV